MPKSSAFRTLICLVLLLSSAACTLATPAPPQVPISGVQETQAPVETQIIDPSETFAPGLTLTEVVTPSETVVFIPTLELTEPPAESSPFPLPSLIATEALPLETPVPSPSAEAAPSPAEGQALLTTFATFPPYARQPNSPVYLPNFARAEGCNWLGVAGQVFDGAGNPQKFIVVNIDGVLGGTGIANLGMSGNATAYGSAGFEVDLANRVIASTQTLSIYLTDLQGNVISERYPFDTFADCSRNLVVINFRYYGPYRFYFPIIGR